MTEQSTRQDEFKSLSVSELRDILRDLPDDYRICANDVGNLAVIEKQESGYLVYRGYIDLMPKGQLNMDDD